MLCTLLLQVRKYDEVPVRTILFLRVDGAPCRAVGAPFSPLHLKQPESATELNHRGYVSTPVRLFVCLPAGISQNLLMEGWDMGKGSYILVWVLFFLTLHDGECQILIFRGLPFCVTWALAEMCTLLSAILVRIIIFNISCIINNTRAYMVNLRYFEEFF